MTIGMKVPRNVEMKNHVKKALCMFGAFAVVFLCASASPSGQGPGPDKPKDGKEAKDAKEGQRLFERETFGGNGRTCRTCHTRETGTVSPLEAQMRFRRDPHDPLFVHDGSDDGNGVGVTRILADATLLMRIPLPPNVTVAADPGATSVVVRRGIPTTLNTPALDPVLMLDGRQPTLQSQAMGAIRDHAEARIFPTARELDQIKAFELTDEFFSSPALKDFAHGRPAPTLPPGRTDSEKRGRRFFEDAFDFVDFKHGLCGACHSGPMLNQTNAFFEALTFGVVPAGSRFQSVLVSELNAAKNPLIRFNFNGTGIVSPDPGRALITGNLVDLNAFKIPTLWGVRHTAPYFHDNSAKTLEAVAAHYAQFFFIVTGPGFPGGTDPPLVILTPQDQADIVAYMKLL
jgi:cytochrome c peroxidase